MNFRWTAMVAGMALTLAVVGATWHAGGWNDASRLATVESLVDRHTWIIDDSVFVRPTTQTPHPYGPLASVTPLGTLDKIYINGHFYSDKSPAPAVAMASTYQIWRWLGGPSAAERPDWFCWVMSLIWAGGAFVLGVLAMDRLADSAHLSSKCRFVLVVSFAAGTIALPYSRSVNNHILLLAVTAWLLVVFERIDAQSWTALRSYPGPNAAGRQSITTSGLVLWAGALAGVAYTIDLGAGPVIALTMLVVTAIRMRSWKLILIMGLAAAPGITLHHVLNYSIGGTIGPANANPEYFRWPGCPFNETNLTGGWPHRSIWAFGVYALDMLVGKKGLFTHQPQLWLALIAVVVLIKQQSVRPSMVLLTAGWCAGVWLIYAAASRNMSGQCVSIRWFVPLLAPAFYWLIQALKFRPVVANDLAILSAAGVVINGVNWYRGPWSGSTGAVIWICVALAGLTWGWVAYRRGNKPALKTTSIRQAA